MKKLKRGWLLVLSLMMLFYIALPLEKAEAKTTYYESYICYVRTLKKSKGKIVIKTVRPTNHGAGEQEAFSLKLKPAKNIQYTKWSVGGWEPMEYITFDQMKKEAKSAYKEYKRTGTYMSPAGFYVFIKKNKIVEIRLLYS